MSGIFRKLMFFSNLLKRRKPEPQDFVEEKWVANFSKENGYRFYCLTSSPSSDVEQIISELGLEYEFCFTDDVTLRTIIRANPGLVLLQNGTVIGKWHHNNMPSVDELKPNLLSFALQQQAEKSKKRLNRGLLLAFAFVAFAFYHFRKSPIQNN